MPLMSRFWEPAVRSISGRPEEEGTGSAAAPAVALAFDPG